MDSNLDAANAQRLNILDAVVLAIEQRSELVDIVATSESSDAARTLLQTTWGLDEFQAQAVLDLQVRRFTRQDVARLIAERDGFRSQLNEESDRNCTHGTSREEPDESESAVATGWFTYQAAPTPQKPAWFTDLLVLMINGPGTPDTINGIVEQRVFEHDGLLDFRYRIQRRGHLVRCTALWGGVHYIAGATTNWCRDDVGSFYSEFRGVGGGWIPAPDDYEFGAYRDDEHRWDGTDFTTPSGEPRPVTYLGRDALDIDLAPPTHKGTAPLTMTVDRQTGLILQRAHVESGTHTRWVCLDLAAHLPDELFVLIETDTPAQHDY